MPRPPIIPLETVKGDNGGEWASVRTFKGGCGVGTPPCQHFGFDAIGKGGTEVAAPTAGWILVSQPWSDAYPFGGYGPAVVLLANDDTDTTGWTSTRYTLLGHLSADSLRYRVPWAKNAKFIEASLVSDQSRLDNGWLKLDDGAIVKTKPGLIGPDEAFPKDTPYVKEGTVLGTTAKGYDHTHWEVRIQPLAGPKVERPDGVKVDGRIDPIGWLKAVDPHDSWNLLGPSYKPPTPSTPAKSDGGIGLLVVGGLILLSMDDKPRRRR